MNITIWQVTGAEQDKARARGKIAGAVAAPADHCGRVITAAGLYAATQAAPQRKKARPASQLTLWQACHGVGNVQRPVPLPRL